MKFKKIFAIALMSLLAFGFISGCKTVANGEGTKTVTAAAAIVTNAEANVAENTQQKIETIGEFSYGTSLALQNIYTLPTFETLPEEFKLSLDAAVFTNNLVRSLAPSPSAEKMLAMEKLVSQLTSDLETERLIGKKTTELFKEHVITLNKTGDELKAKLDQANKDFKELTFTLGIKVDALSGELATEKAKTTDLNGKLEKFDEGFGWYAIKHGLLVFFKKIMWITIGLGAAFLILKILSASSPIAASIFSVFESIIGFFVKGIFSLFPKAVKFSGNIDLPTFKKVESTRDKLVDTIESLYRIEKATPGKTFTLNELFDELEKNMDEADKAEIKAALAKLGWNH